MVHKHSKRISVMIVSFPFFTLFSFQISKIKERGEKKKTKNSHDDFISGFNNIKQITKFQIQIFQLINV